MCVVFNGRRKTGRLDLEAAETAVRAAMHYAGSVALTELRQFAAPTTEEGRAIACDCGQLARYREPLKVSKFFKSSFQPKLADHYPKGGVGGGEGHVLLRKQALLLVVVAIVVTIAYGNHFQNSFHFDDSHTIQENSYIRNLRNLPLFFTDATTFSVLPANRSFRPFVTASLALDYALARGYKAFWFHLSTFIVFLLQLLAMYELFDAILTAVRPESENAQANQFVSLAATAWYGLHPAMDDTVNYIIQRGDIYSTLGVVAALGLFVRLPRWRKFGLYLLPLSFAMLSKPPAVVFPVLLFLYVAMFEPQGKDRFVKAGLTALPALATCTALMALQYAMTPKSFTPSTISEYSYCITQPYVLLRYAGEFFLPIHLNIDTDLHPFASLDGLALAGSLFVAALMVLAILTARPLRTRPISYGLLWFVIASLPTSLYRLSEVENDHRMFMPIVGLVLAVVWRLIWEQKHSPSGSIESLFGALWPLPPFCCCSPTVTARISGIGCGDRKQRFGWTT